MDKEKIESGKVAWFTKEIKSQILKRDWNKCILCWSTFMLNSHHIYYWTQSEIKPWRNDVCKWVTVCQECHGNKIHICRMWQWERQECINYITNYYGKNKKTTYW